MFSDEIMLSNDIYLMIRIFQNLIEPQSNDAWRPEVYVKDFKEEIETVGVVFEYLGLAENDADSLLGWRPTRELIRVIAEKLCGTHKKDRRPIDGLVMGLVFDAVLGDKREYGTSLTFETLTFLGLLWESKDELITKETPRLYELYVEARDRRREQDAERSARKSNTRRLISMKK